MRDSFYENLGKKIKDQRKKIHLTQAELAGDLLGRSMLSQIENGLAHPSLETLLHLADRLQISPAFLVCSNEKEEALYQRMELIREIRRLFATRQYHKCATLCRADDAFGADDEISFILARCELMLASSHLQKSALNSALSHIQTAKNVAAVTLYGTEEITAQIALIELLIDAVKNHESPTTQQLQQYMSYTPPDLMLYLVLFSRLEAGDTLPPDVLEAIPNFAYRHYLSARLSMLREDYSAAAAVLHSICSMPPGFFTQFFALRDMEQCCKKTENYKEAYEYAKRQIALPDLYAK